MVDHVCDLADLLDTLKIDIAERGVVLANGDRNSSVDASLKASAAFARSWRILGLAEFGWPTGESDLSHFAVACMQLALAHSDNGDLIGRELRGMRKRFPWVHMAVLPELGMFGASSDYAQTLPGDMLDFTLTGETLVSPRVS